MFGFFSSKQKKCDDLSESLESLAIDDQVSEKTARCVIKSKGFKLKTEKGLRNFCYNFMKSPIDPGSFSHQASSMLHPAIVRLKTMHSFLDNPRKLNKFFEMNSFPNYPSLYLFAITYEIFAGIRTINHSQKMEIAYAWAAKPKLTLPPKIDSDCSSDEMETPEPPRKRVFKTPKFDSKIIGDLKRDLSRWDYRDDDSLNPRDITLLDSIRDKLHKISYLSFGGSCYNPTICFDILKSMKSEAQMISEAGIKARIVSLITQI